MKHPIETITRVRLLQRVTLDMEVRFEQQLVEIRELCRLIHEDQHNFKFLDRIVADLLGVEIGTVLGISDGLYDQYLEGIDAAPP